MSSKFYIYGPLTNNTYVEMTEIAPYTYRVAYNIDPTKSFFFNTDQRTGQYDLRGTNAAGQYATSGQVFYSTEFAINPQVTGMYNITVDNINSTFSITGPIPCFKEDSKILTDKGYIPIQDLRKGDLVKTLLHDYKPIDTIGKTDINHYALKERIADQLYKCSQTEYPEIFEPLVITGRHSILVDSFISKEQQEKVIGVNGDTYITDKKYRLPAFADENASVYEIPGNYTIYHLALENDNDDSNYGIYANGLLVESCSKRCLKEFSNITLIE